MLTSSALVGFGISSGFLGTFCFKPSLLEGRVGLSSESEGFSDERLVDGVAPRGCFDEGGMVVVCCWEPVPGGCCDGRGEAEGFWRAEPAPGGVGECRVFMVSTQRRRRRQRQQRGGQAGRTSAESV